MPGKNGFVNYAANPWAGNLVAKPEQLEQVVAGADQPTIPLSPSPRVPRQQELPEPSTLLNLAEYPAPPSPSVSALNVPGLFRQQLPTHPVPQVRQLIGDAAPGRLAAIRCRGGFSPAMSVGESVPSA